jgi:hypothetical protein
MKSTRRYRNLLTALAVSVALNFILGIVASVAYGENSQRFPRLARLFDFLAAPSNAIADRLAPSGHEAAHFIGAAIVAIVSSILFYALLVWSRVHRQLLKQSGSSSNQE